MRVSWNKYRPGVVDQVKTAPWSKYQRAETTASAFFDTIEVPAFQEITTPWPGASIIVTEFPFDLGETCSLILPIDIPQVSTFCLAARDNLGNRYKLWQDVGEILIYPLYLGEKFPGGEIVIEVWSVFGPTQATNLASIYLPCSLQTPETECSCTCTRTNTNTLGIEDNTLFGNYNLPYNLNLPY